MISIPDVRSALPNFRVADRHFAMGRSTMALGHLTLLVFTAPQALFVDVYSTESAPHCGGLAHASLYCLGPGGATAPWRRWLLVLILLSVIAGYLPRFTGVLHCWAAASIAQSLALPDGGDTLASVATPLILLICLYDGRSNHWHRRPVPTGELRRGIALAALVLLRVQLAFLYLDAGIAKMGKLTWQQGSAEYYFLRDSMFGAGGIFGHSLLQVSLIPSVTLLMTWGAVLVELVIALGVISTGRLKLVALIADIALHGAIIIFMGLWSFGLIAIGAVVLATGSYTSGPGPEPAPEPDPGQERVSPPLVVAQNGL